LRRRRYSAHGTYRNCPLSSKTEYWRGEPGPKEQFDPNGQQAIRDRVLPLFDEVKKLHKEIFRGNEEITLNNRALAFMVSELARYDLTHTDLDAKGAAYQEIVGSNLKGDRGQFFTPRGAIKLMVQMLDPKPKERLLDPACGTGGFLVAVLAHVLRKMRAEAGVKAGDDESATAKGVVKRFRECARTQIFGADFDEALVRATQMNLEMASNEMGHAYHIDSVEFPSGQLGGVEAANKEIKLGTIDVLLTNPPFGSKIPITDPNVLRHYDLAHVWERRDDGTFANTGRVQGSVAPEILFIERCLEWLRPGGRMGIVLPDGILGSPGEQVEAIRWWIMQHAWVLASVDLPVEPFIVEANVNILTSLLFLQKKTEAERMREAQTGLTDYPVFMAVVEKVGYDRRGKPLFKRRPDGEEIIEIQEEQERITIDSRPVVTTLRRPRKIPDNDLPAVADAYAEFRRQQKEPRS
jgi:type I restriction enzyme M protein